MLTAPSTSTALFWPSSSPCLSLGSGMAGFMGIERYSAPDAFYMTVITVSTVGFGELHPLSEAGAHVCVVLYPLQPGGGGLPGVGAVHVYL
ncbi:MAG: potassium channel family protein [Hymenobacter sp.]